MVIIFFKNTSIKVWIKLNGTVSLHGLKRDILGVGIRNFDIFYTHSNYFIYLFAIIEKEISRILMKDLSIFYLFNRLK